MRRAEFIREFFELTFKPFLASTRLENRGIIRVTGKDAEKFLNGLTTNNVAKIASGDGQRNLFLTPNVRSTSYNYENI